ncbi:MAG: hypothetical protein WCK27_23470 [Verrucomicrobiota bacterium]
MKILRKLTGTATDEPWAEAPVYHHSVGHNLPGGAFRSVRVGPEGLIVSNGLAHVALPMEELFDLVEPVLAAMNAEPPKG